jgi:GntP family gluconate:H+ symporter
MHPLLIVLVGVAIVIGGILLFRLHAFLVLIVAALVVTALTPADPAVKDAPTVGERVAESFGSTCGKIGILIAMAAIIGKCLLDSGAADKIVRSALKLFGERGAPAAFVSSGFLLGIPVFFDTVFYLMIPLGKALRMRTGHNYLLYVLTIVCGATMAHSLVPPTPGPLFVAEELGVDIGLMIMFGCIVGIFSSGTGFVYALLMNRRFDLPIRESVDFSLSDLDELVNRDESELPPLWVSLMPILLPVILIAGYTILKNYSEQFSPTFMQVAETFGNKNIALVISAAIALITLVWQKKPAARRCPSRFNLRWPAAA